MGVDFWSLDSLEHIKHVQVNSKIPASLASSAHLDIIAVGSEGVSIIDAIEIEQVGYLDVSGNIVGIAFSPDGGRLATVSAPGRISILSSRDWRSIEEGSGPKQLTLPDRFGYENPTRVAFTSNGEKIAVAYQRGGVLVWSLPKSDEASGQGAGGESDQPMPQDIEGLKGSASSVLFQAAGNVLAAGFADGSIRIVDLDIRPQAPVEHMMSGTTPIVDLAFADGERLISLDMAGTIRVWAAAPRYHLRAKLSSSSYSDDCVAFSGESSLVVRRRPGDDIFDYPETRLYELEANGLGAVTRQERWGLGDFPSGRPCEEFPSARRVSDAEEDARHTFGSQLGESVPAIERPSVSLHIENLVDGVKPVVTRNGEAIVGETRDGRLSVWDSAGTKTATWNVPSPVAQLELSPDDRIILARLASGDVFLWPMPSSIEELIDTARNRLPPCLTSDEAGTTGLAGR
jgi:WD40 repeat protein